jgi:Ca-activated chloride channel homolog
MTVKFRYKEPREDVSKLIVHSVKDKQIKLENSSSDFRFSAAVASFGMLLRDSQYKGTTSYESVLEMAKNSKGTDEEGYRAEFIKLVRTASMLPVVGKK